jgi:hypothetical protein
MASFDNSPPLHRPFPPARFRVASVQRQPARDVLVPLFVWAALFASALVKVRLPMRTNARAMLPKKAPRSLLRHSIRKLHVRKFHCTSVSMMKRGERVRGESGHEYCLVSPFSAQSAEREPNVWKSVDVKDESMEYVLKGPSPQDDASLGWPFFKHEVQMQQRFIESPFIRKMVDYVPTSDSKKPMMVLQAFEKTLWDARNRRALTRDEIRWIMKAVLIGLWTIHRDGLVHSGKSRLCD